MRAVLCVLMLLWPCIPRAQSADPQTDPGTNTDAGPGIGAIMPAIRAGDWLTADQAAAADPDPVGRKLVTFYRLQHPGAASVSELAAFIAANPDWPAQPVLLKRRDEALAAEPDDTVVLGLCGATLAVAAPRAGAALARCAQAAADAGHAADARALAASAWVAGLPDADSTARFLQRWQPVLTPQDEQERFRALLAVNDPQAGVQLGRLAPPAQAVGRARLAVRGNDPRAPALIAALPVALRSDPDLLLDRLRALRRADATDDARALWDAGGEAAERAAGAPLAAAFWAERSALARRLLQATTGSDRLAADGLAVSRDAYRLARDMGQTEPEPQADAAFLAGFIALRRLNEPAVAAMHFRALAGATAAISQGRAHYWLGRAAEAAGDAAGARAEYAAAGTFPTTYYGQLGLLALGLDAPALAGRIQALADPAWTRQQALDFAGRELARAAATLVAWGEPGRARPFLQQVTVLAADPATRSLDAHLALGLGLPDQAVAASRRAGRDGTLLPQAGWPQLDVTDDAVPSRLPLAVALGIIRQESSFDPGAVSPSGARGLMQLMPPTAAATARGLGLPVSTAALTADPALNVRLGRAYLADLADRFGGALPLAIAAYNAGPGRVQQWLAASDPRGQGRAAMIDWVELIPFSETRNYVQRVIENIAVYGAHRHEPAAYPVGG